MKTHSPAVDLVDIGVGMAKMVADSDGEWIHLEDHLAVVAENALQMKRRDVEIERLTRFVNQFIDLGLMQSDATQFSLLDGEF